MHGSSPGCHFFSQILMIYPVLADNYREYLTVWPVLPTHDVYEPSPCDASQ